MSSKMSFCTYTDFVKKVHAPSNYDPDARVIISTEQPGTSVYGARSGIGGQQGFTQGGYNSSVQASQQNNNI